MAAARKKRSILVHKMMVSQGGARSVLGTVAPLGTFEETTIGSTDFGDRMEVDEIHDGADESAHEGASLGLPDEAVSFSFSEKKGYMYILLCVG
jgi:hypothetical protein